MKKLMVALLCFSMLCLTACQDKSVIVPAEESSSVVVSSSSSEVEKPPINDTKPSESEPKESSKASVPEVSSTAPALELKKLYAVNTNSYIMAEVSDTALIKEILSELEDKKADNTSSNGLAYFITDKDGKQYQYLNDNDTALTKKCLATLTNEKLHPSWLIHMTPAKIVSANSVTDKEKILKLADFLKGEVTVGAETRSNKGSVNPSMVAGLFDLRIQFDSGVKYNIIGYDYFDGTGNFSIYSSDLDTYVSYKLDNGVAAKITSFLNTLE